MKRILLLTYYWPPDNSSGVQRWAYFSHFLQKEGFHLDVVTVNPKKASYKNTDDSFMTLVSAIPTYTTSTFELLKVYSLLTTGDTKKGIPRGSVDHKKGVFKKIATWMKANFFVPDARVGWNKYAYSTAKEHITNHTIVITTGPPQSTHLIGLKLKKRFPDITWLADFRDPWLELYSNQNQPQSKWAARRNMKLENTVLNKADIVTTIGPSLAKLLQNKVKDKSKIHYFYNGYDAQKMDNITPLKSTKFTITFIGLLAPEYETDGYIKALSTLLATKSHGDITLQLAGNIAPSFLEQVKSIPNLEVDYLGFIPHIHSLQLMKSASVLFTILPTQPQDEIIISGKLMEYLAANKPILCMGNKKGDAAALIKKCNAGLVVSHNESDAMVKFINQCYSNEFILKKDKHISAYSREQVSVQLATLLKGF